jgi:branched-chain amino acid transport system ATP-binding protein
MDTPFLEVRGIDVTYNGVARALKGVSLQVQQGQIAVLLGGNGAGKTTVLRAISNLLAVERGTVSAGSVYLRGDRIDGLDACTMVRRGLVQVMEGRHCFPNLTLHENLLAGAYRVDASTIQASIAKVYRYFPRLYERRHSKAAVTSGGEQQMCAIGRALMTNASLVLLDEPSMGLAPKVVAEVFEIVQQLNREEGVTFLIAEQNATSALRNSHVAFVIEDGRVALHGCSDVLADDPRIQQAYLGGLADAQFDFRSEALRRGTKSLQRSSAQ